MATRKTAKKAVKKTAAKKKTAVKTKTAAKAVKKAAPKKAAQASQKTSPAKGSKAGGGSGNIRVRMYRIGFGDFFLLTVPGKSGPAHILIDCGVHAANINTINDCVQDMKKETGNRLALVILTHYHADHMSGFASNFDDFAEFDVGAVWITNRLDPKNAQHAKFMAQLTSVATQLRLQLGARTDDAGMEAQRKAENALGVSGNGNGGSNAKALKLLQSGFKNKPPVYYYQGGDDPTLPDELQDMVTAEILGPSPIDSDGEFSASDNKKEQYLAAAGDNGLPDTRHISPFEGAKWKAGPADYPSETFNEFVTGNGEGGAQKLNGPIQLESTLAGMQPDALAAAADKLDGTLNNQSLVVLFTCQGKKLLFVGDAQWGNWAYWLYGKAITGADPGISQRAKDILGSIDFYKVGHHGSTNANPIPAIAALNKDCASMCSTATGAYGSPSKKTEVPRTALMDALEKQTGNRLVRSDWVKAGKNNPDDQAREELANLPSGFTTPGDLYIDYIL